MKYEVTSRTMISQLLTVTPAVTPEGGGASIPRIYFIRGKGNGKVEPSRLDAYPATDFLINV